MHAENNKPTITKDEPIEGNGMVLGMRVISFTNNRLDGHNCTFVNKQFQDEKYEIVVLYGSQLVQLTCSTSHGQCGSGWTTATWGRIEWKRVNEVGSLHFTPIEYTELSFNLYSIPNTITNSLFEYSGYGFDDYYPSGYFNIEMDAWRTTGRKPEKPMVHLFHGDNASGKSTLASLTNKSVVESDSFDSGDKFIDSIPMNKPMGDVILVVGGKHQIDLDTVVAILEEHNTVVKVNFSF